jgi:hypothetical protein
LRTERRGGRLHNKEHDQMKRTRTLLALALAALPLFAVAQGAIRPAPAVDRGPVQGLQPANVSAIQALGGEGLYSFFGAKVTNLRVTGPTQGNRFALQEQSEGASAFNAHIDAGSFVINGERVRVSSPTEAIAVPDGSVQIVYGGAVRPVHLSVRLEAFDISGQPMRNFLRTSNAHAMSESARVGDRRFPAGSVAYIVNAQFLDDVLVLPSRESFSGATNTRALLTNFSRTVPYCLSYDDRAGARPYALLFSDAAAQRGKAVLFAAKPGTVFCDKVGDRPIAEGRWEEITVAGTRAVVLSFGSEVDPLDTGVTDVERAAASIAFVEPTKGAPGVRPGKMYRAGAAIIDHQFRFNGTAANAVRAAMAGG